jgi:predicted nuclease of predicted toxin-antitoxin system
MSWVNVEDTIDQLPSKREIDEVEHYAKLKKTKSKFYADENFPAQAIEILRGKGFDVLTAQEAGKQGHPDENHISEARRRGRVLITCDKDYLNDRIFPLIHCPTIVVCDFGSQTTDEIISAFQCLAYVASFPRFYDKWCKIKAGREEWVEHIRFQDGSTSRDRYRFFQGKMQVWQAD